MEKSKIKKGDTVTITTEEYRRLKDRELWAEALGEAGVDNWEGISDAQELFDELQREAIK